MKKILSSKSSEGHSCLYKTRKIQVISGGTMKETCTRWSLKSFFPSFNGKEMKSFKEKLGQDISDLTRLAGKTPVLSSTTIKKWEKIFLQFEDLFSRMTHLETYVSCLSADDARNEDYQKETSAFTIMRAEFSKIDVELKRGFRKVSDVLFRKFINLSELKEYSYFLGRIRQEAGKTMSSCEETLAADLSVDGMCAWENLYNKVSSKMEFEMVFPDGRKEKRPMAQRRSLMEDADPRIRKAAFENGNKIWAAFEDVIAGALNHIAGSRLTLYKHRGIKHFLDIPLFQAGISKKTLEAMFKAVNSRLDVPRRVARAKAQLLGMRALSWQDFDAQLPAPAMEQVAPKKLAGGLPMPGNGLRQKGAQRSGQSKEDTRLSWVEGKNLVERAFDRVFPKLGDFFRDALKNEWIESQPRPGKRPGAFCTGSLLNRESRIFMTYEGSLGDVETLAHETGHAYHNFVMREKMPLARIYPMTLAESASTFAEMILCDGLLADSKISENRKTQILNLNNSNAMAFLMNIPIRFDFEKNFYEERAKGEIPVSRIKEMMVESQRKIYGDTLSKGGEDPYFWASKLHFYFTDVAFYNFPYTFGFLLSRGLFALLKKHGPPFLKKYDEFLSLTGSDTAENVA